MTEADADFTPGTPTRGNNAASMIAVLNSVSDAFIAMDRDWRITFVNDSYMRLVSALYSKKEDLVGHNLWERFPDIEHGPTGTRYRTAMEEQRRDDFELYYGPLAVWLDIRVHPSPQGLGIYIQDITGRKEQEQRVKKLADQIEQQARLFDATLSNMTDLAYSFDREARVIYANRPLLKLWGRKLGDVIGKNVYDLQYPEPMATRLHQELLHVVATGEPILAEIPWELPDGTVEHHEYSYNPVFGSDGTVVAVAGTTRFVTARKRVESELRKAKEEAEAASAAKDRFLAVLSHELRTPLALEEDEALPLRVREELRMIHRNVGLEARLIDDLLDLSSITNGKLQLRACIQDIPEAVRQACDICRPQIEAKQLELRLRFTRSANAVQADPARLQQMLWNLVKNAVKFTPAGGWIEIATERVSEEQVRICITDSGIGIDGTFLSRIFDAFEQGEARVAHFGGLGLGLAITKALAELHGGEVSAHSDGPGCGASFTLTLPAAAEPASEDEPVSSQAPAASRAAAQDQPRVRVLLVEDHEDTAWAMARLLHRAGCDVTHAATVAAAVELTSQEAFHMLISDVGLPDGSGHDLMRHIRGNQGSDGQARMHAIAVSGYGMEEDLRQSRDAGFDEHLVKPIGLQQLRDVIGRLGVVL